MLAHILSSFAGIEKMSHHFVFDYVADLFWLGKLEEDGAIAYLQIEADLQTYQLMLSRDQNFRPRDTTSVFSNANPARYLARLFMREGDRVVSRIHRENPWLHEAPHDGLRQAALYFSAFGDRLRLVHIVREPQDLIADLVRRGFGWRLGMDPREFQFTLSRGGGVVPIAFRDFEVDVSELSGPDVAAITVAESMQNNLEGFFSLNAEDKERVKVVFFDDFCEQPDRMVSVLSAFLGVSTTWRTRGAVRRENLPRNLPAREQSRFLPLSEMSDIGKSALDRSLGIYSEMRDLFGATN